MDVHREVKKAIADGRLPRPTRCERCKQAGEYGNGLVYHHPDYSKPLLVVALCIGCHNTVHAELRRGQPSRHPVVDINDHFQIPKATKATKATMNHTITFPNDLDKALQRAAKEDDRKITNYVVRAVREKLLRDGKVCPRCHGRETIRKPYTHDDTIPCPQCQDGAEPFAGTPCQQGQG